MVLGISTGSTDALQMISQMRTTFLKNFAESYNKTDSDKEKKINNEVKSLMESADKDKSGGLSVEELSSIDTKNNPDLAKDIRDLINGFDSYDTNHDNQLSVKELKDALKTLKKEFSLQDVAKMAKENEEFMNSGLSPTSFSSSMAEKLISSYGGSSISLTSSLGIDC